MTKKYKQSVDVIALSLVTEGLALANRMNNQKQIIHLNKVRSELLEEMTNEPA